MKPKKHNEFKKDIAKEVGVHSNVVNDFISYYYAQVRKELSNLTATNIYVQGLGTFSLKKGKLKNAIIKNKNIFCHTAFFYFLFYVQDLMLKNTSV